jgi:hypothetical protein
MIKILKVNSPAKRCQRRTSIRARIALDFGGAWSHPTAFSRLRSIIEATDSTDFPAKICHARKERNGERNTRRILTNDMSIKSFAAENRGLRCMPLLAAFNFILFLLNLGLSVKLYALF